jgi:DNA-directed RNA polymerase specialized sigma24 family protein
VIEMELTLTSRHVNIASVIARGYRKKGMPPRVVEELEGAVVLALLRASRRYEPTRDARAGTEQAGETYLFRCAHLAANRFSKVWWKSARRRKGPDVIPITDLGLFVGARITHPPAPRDDNHNADRAREFIVRLKRSLTADEWRILHLHVMKGVRLLDLATLLGVHPEMLRQRVNRIKKRVRERFTP